MEEIILKDALQKLKIWNHTKTNYIEVDSSFIENQIEDGIGIESRCVKIDIGEDFHFDFYPKRGKIIKYVQKSRR